MTAPGTEHDAMLEAARLLDLDPSGANLVSSSSRLIWHLPAAAVALTISRPGTKTRADVDAETAAMRAAASAGVRTPRLRRGPAPVQHDRWAFAADWIDGRRPEPDDWPAIARTAAQLATAPTAGLRPFSWPDELDDPRIGDVLGADLHAELLDRSAAAEREFTELVASGPLVLAHTDLQPANALRDGAGAWLLDMEYASLAPREWDPAKLVILARRFGEPRLVDELLDAWGVVDNPRLRRCVGVQELLLVAWLARMAAYGQARTAGEARHRAASLGTEEIRWYHLT